MTDKNREIEEMAKDICHLPCKCEDCTYPKYRKRIEKCRARVYSERAYNAGYRKKECGKWSRFEVNSSKGYGQVYYQHKDCDFNATQLFPSPYPYCPNCGAKMRKEDEKNG